jgi:uracil-DNA glycosylase
MSSADPGRNDLRARLEWLRLLGVDDLPRAESDRARPVEPEREATPATTTAGQATLFGGSVEAPEPPRETRRPRKMESVDAASPLASLPQADAADPAVALALIRDDIGDCRRCRLCEKRTNVVFGVGNPGARLMFIGEGPGADEDAQGEPFVGRAGQLLTKIIEAMQMGRPDVYIANIVKCRPPENRTPLPDEVSICSPFLFRQIAAIRPRVIVCLGTPAAQTLLGTRETITRMRGVFREVGGIKVMPTFHPAYLLRNPAAKREVWEDMKQVMTALQAG